MAMIVTTDIIRQIFEKYRGDFEKNLAVPQFGIVHTYRYSGDFTCRKWKNGTVRNPRIRVTDYFDWDEDVLEIVVVHEMIHYYIARYKIKDNDEHGERFQAFCDMFNQRYGMVITSVLDCTGFRRRKGAPRLPWLFANLFG